MSIPANVSRIAFQLPGSGVEFRVLGFTHREALSDSFCSELDLTCERPDLQLQNYLGHAATVALHHEHGVRYFHGCVAEMGQGRVGKRFHSYHAVIRPLFWQLGMRSGLRIFQDQTVPDIVKTVLNDAGIQQKDLRFEIAGAYPQRPYCCQYNETDLDFISRLLEQEGLFYYFEHQESGHCLVISDKRHSFSPIPGASAVLYRDPACMAAPQESVYEFHCQQQLRAGAISGQDYFFEKPSLSLNAQATTGPWTSLEQHRYPGHFHQTQQGQHRVNTALGAEQQDQHRFEGKSDCPRLAAGKRVRFTDLPQDQTDSEYLLTHIEINATQPQAMEAEASDEGGSFAITFSAIPADNSYYPKQTTPYPRVVGIQTAVVTGPKGEEIYTDAHGRVKVQFHWDREGNKDQHSSCWLRVSRAWAGNQWGAFVLPRIGQEVIVRHLNGDPDQPIITGALYNQTNHPPDTLPQHKTRTVYKSQTTPGGGGYNELYLDDQKDQEQIFIHGQRDIDVYVKNDLNKTVHSDHHQIVNQEHLQEIGADLDISIGQNQNNHIGGNLNQTVGQNFTQISGQDHRLQTGADLHLKSNTDITLDAGESITLKGGGGSIVLDTMGVAINGVQVRINSGGSARGAKTTAPQKPQAPEQVNPSTSGQPLNKRAEQKQSQQTPVEFDASRFKALNRQEAEVPQQNINETNATTALEESEQNAIAYWQQAELSATNPMAAVGSRIMRLNAEAGYGIAAGAVALYETLTNKDKFIAAAQGIYDTLSDPEQMYDDVKQATQEFAELPAEQQGEAAYKLLVGTLAGGGAAKVSKIGKTATKKETLNKQLKSKRFSPNSLQEAEQRLKARRREIERNGYTPKYTDEELAILAQNGDVGNERFQVRFMEEKYLQNRDSPSIPLSGALGVTMQGASGKGAKYWSTSFDQLEDTDTDPKLISEKLGLTYDSKRNYALIIIDTEKAIPLTGVKSVPATFEKVGEFANRELPDTFPKSFTDKAMTPEFQKEYSQHYKAADARGVFGKKWSVKNFEKYLNSTELSQDKKRLMSQRFIMHGTIGNNEDYLGNGLTKNNNNMVDSEYGVVETLNFERRETSLSKLENRNAITVISRL